MIPVLPVAAMCVAYLCSDPYCRSNVNTGVPNDPHAHCLWWEDTNITWVQSSVGNPATGPSAFTSTESAWASWQAVATPCSSLQLTEGPRSSSRAIGYNQNGPNENLILFRLKACSDPGVVPAGDPCAAAGDCNNAYDCWGYQASTIALTTTTYDKNTGILFDADIELNAAKFVFTTVNSPPCFPSAQNQTCVATDIQNTLTHEAGHALGLDHNTSATSTMYNSAPVGETSKRTIDPGSAAFICHTYPDGGPSRDCIIDPVVEPLGNTAGCGSANGNPLIVLALLAAGGVGLRLRRGWRRSVR